MPRFLRALFPALLLLALAAPASAEAVRVLMETSKGPITLELYPDKAPQTVENFLRYVDDGFYDGTVFTASSRNS